MNKVLRIVFWIILILIAVFIGLKYTVGHSGLTIILGLLVKTIGERIDNKIFKVNSN